MLECECANGRERKNKERERNVWYLKGCWGLCSGLFVFYNDLHYGVHMHLCTCMYIVCSYY